MTTLTADRAGGPGRYQLRDEQGNVQAWLRAGWSLHSGEIRTGSGRWPVRRRGWRQVIAGAEDRPVLRLTAGQAGAPGPGADAHWTITRRRGGWRASLTRGAESIQMRLAAPFGRHCDVDVSGDWPDRDLLVLAGLFALLVRRRRLVILISGGTR